MTNIADLVQESTVTTGNGLTIALTAVSGFGRFANAFSTGDSVCYSIEDSDNRETGVGTVQAGNAFDRTTPQVTYESSVYADSSPARITLSGSARIFCGPNSDVLNNKHPKAEIIGVNAQTGTTYTTVLTDAGKLVKMNNAAANIFTVPPSSSVAYDINTVIHVWQEGLGQTTVAQGVGVTIRTSETLLAAKQYAMLSLIKVAVDEWILTGERELA